MLSHLVIAFVGGMVLGMISIADGKGGEVGFGASITVSIISLIIVVTTAHFVGKALYKKQEAEKLMMSSEQAAAPNPLPPEQPGE